MPKVTVQGTTLYTVVIKKVEIEKANGKDVLEIYCHPCSSINIKPLFCFKVSQVYQTVEFSRLLSLVPFASEFQLERAIVDVALQNELQV